MNLTELNNEVKYRTSRSGGAGGQHVNKVSTKVELLFNVIESQALSNKEKETIKIKLGNRISTKGVLSMTCDRTRSQLKNKEIVLNRLIEMLQEALKPVKKRKVSKPSKSAIQKRLSAKKQLSQKKDSRRFKSDND